MTLLDWFIVTVYFIFSAAIGVAFAGRAGRSITEFFLSGRSLPWWLAGTSMVATTFAADTPLAVTGMVAENGIAGNWLWWSFVMSGILTVFFYAHLWRRAEVLTDAEFAEIRYAGQPAAILRAFRALYLALPINLIIIGWVNLAMLKVLNVALGVSPVTAFLFLFVLTMSYSVLAGLWGVVLTDFVQFLVAMAGSITLAFYAVGAVGGIDGLIERLPEHYPSAEAALSFFPSSGAAWMPITAVLAYLTVQWWATYYPGAEPGGGGYVAQRIFSARTERDGVLATLWFNIAMYAIRPWPWIVTALAAVVLYPGLEDPGEGYVRAIVDLLPPGVTGLLLASFAAAYMSTISTQLNWGASYLVNDIYVRFVAPDAPQRRIVEMSRLATAAIFLLSALFTWWLYGRSVEAAWRILLAIGGGTGLVYILRWYWWRINAWSEISAMVASFVAFVVLTVTGVLDPLDMEQSAILMLVTTAITTVVWIAVTILTRPVPEATLHAFYRRVRPGGPGWARISDALGYGREPAAAGALSWLNWVAGVVSVYAALFGIGKILFGSPLEAVAYLALAAAAFAWIARSLRSDRIWTRPPVEHEATEPAVTPTTPQLPYT
ncbi:MAG: sodium:solute symporter family protein [Longimicrobiales bacterium]